MATEKQNYMNEVLAPLGEDLQRMQVNLRAAEIKWSIVSALFADNATVYDDGQPNAGLTALAESVFFAANTKITALRTELDSIEGALAKIARRPLRITGIA